MKRPPITPATISLDSLGVSYRTHEFVSSADSQYGAEAVAALSKLQGVDVDAGRVFKTIVFDSGESLCVGISPVEFPISPKKLASAVGARNVTPASIDKAQRSTGYVIGGISPFGQKRKLLTIIDESAWYFPTIFVSGGRRGVEIEIEPDTLVRVVDARRAAIAKRT